MKDGLTNGVLRISGVYRMPKYFGVIVLRYSGRIPNTGYLICDMCLTKFHPVTREIL